MTLTTAEGLLLQGREQEALAAARRARRRDGGDAAGLLECQALAALGRGAEASAAVTRALRRGVGGDLEARLRALRARLLWEVGRRGAAREELAEARRRAVSPLAEGEVAATEGHFAWRVHDGDAALEALRRAEDALGRAQAGAERARVLAAQAAVLRDQGRLEEALGVLDRAAATGPGAVTTRVRVTRAGLLGALGRWDDARAALAGEEGPEARVVRAALTLSGGELAEANAVIEDALRAVESAGAPSRLLSGALLVASDVRLAAGDAAGALERAQEALRCGALLRDRETLCRSRVRGVHALLRLGRVGEAVREARRARKSAPESRGDLVALSELALGRSLIASAPAAAGRAFAAARAACGERPGFGHAARLGLALVAGAGREHPDVEACVAGLEAWGDRRVLSYCLADIRAADGPGPLPDLRGGGSSDADDGLAAFSLAAEILLGGGAWADRWTAAAHALSPALPWCRMAVVGPRSWELRRGSAAPGPLEEGDLALELAARCEAPLRVDLVAEPAWRRHPGRVLHGLGTALLAPIDGALTLYADLREGQGAAPASLPLVVQLARLMGRQGAPAAVERAEDDERAPFPGILGRCEAMRALFGRMRRVARWDDTVHIVGETGTGKEKVAHALHLASARAAGPYVAVNASSFADELFDSLMFGHVKGAFTGALADSPGHVGAAEGGTLFLDEVTDLSPRVQPKLLRFLETKEYVRVGESRPRRADVRIVTASNVPLEQCVARGDFRQDLVYRLERLTLELPPLRERGDDVVFLARHFLRQAAERVRAAVPVLTPEVEARLRRHPWPGNVRELLNLAGRLVLESGGGRLRVEDLGDALRAPRPGAAHGLRAAVQEFERRHIGGVLRHAGGNRTWAARALGISRQALVAKISRLGLAVL
jgi:DNA-binding NtrC family response regulator/tetratricopeptide (TPR) repeat protein